MAYSVYRNTREELRLRGLPWIADRACRPAYHLRRQSGSGGWSFNTPATSGGKY